MGKEIQNVQTWAPHEDPDCPLCAGGLELVELREYSDGSICYVGRVGQSNYDLHTSSAEEAYEHLTRIFATIETEEQADRLLPIYLTLAGIKEKSK